MFKRHHLSEVGVQEHHLPDAAALKTAEYHAGLQGYKYVALPSPELKLGVCSLYKPTYINLPGSWSPPLRCWVVYCVLC